MSFFLVVIVVSQPEHTLWGELLGEYINPLRSLPERNSRLPRQRAGGEQGGQAGRFVPCSGFCISLSTSAETSSDVLRQVNLQSY
jgi:hypothetical protein